MEGERLTLLVAENKYKRNKAGYFGVHFANPGRTNEDAMMEDRASRRGYAPTAAWDEGNMIQAMARMKNPTVP